MGNAIRIFVADDHASFRRALVRMISMAPGLELVGEAADGAAARDGCLDLKPDVAILDMMMPRMDGVEVTRIIKRDRPSIKVIMLSVFGQEQHVQRGLTAGADRYLTKGISAEELLAAIRTVVPDGMRATVPTGGDGLGLC